MQSTKGIRNIRAGLAKRDNTILALILESVYFPTISARKFPQEYCTLVVPFSFGVLVRSLISSPQARDSQHCSVISCGKLVRRSKIPAGILHPRGAFCFWCSCEELNLVTAGEGLGKYALPMLFCKAIQPSLEKFSRNGLLFFSKTML